MFPHEFGFVKNQGWICSAPDPEYFETPEPTLFPTHDPTQQPTEQPTGSSNTYIDFVLYCKSTQLYNRFDLTCLLYTGDFRDKMCFGTVQH